MEVSHRLSCAAFQGCCFILSRLQNKPLRATTNWGPSRSRGSPALHLCPIKILSCPTSVTCPMRMESSSEHRWRRIVYDRQSEPEDGGNIFLLNYGSQRILHGVVITDLQTYKTCSSAPKTKYVPPKTLALSDCIPKMDGNFLLY